MGHHAPKERTGIIHWLVRTGTIFYKIQRRNRADHVTGKGLSCWPRVRTEKWILTYAFRFWF